MSGRRGGRPGQSTTGGRAPRSVCRKVDHQILAICGKHSPKREQYSCWIIAVPEAEKFDGFLSVSEGIPWLITKRDLGFSHDFTPTPPSTLSFGVSAVPPSHRNPGKYA